MTNVITLARVRAKLSPVDLGDAGVHQVQPITGEGMELLEASTGGNWRALYEVAALCLPTVTREQLLKLTLQEVEAIVQIASGTAQDVLGALGNDSPPTATDAPAAGQ